MSVRVYWAEFDTAAGGSGAITGNLAATESADTIAVAGIVLIQGALAVTETVADTFAGTGDASAEVIGNLSTSESGTDTLSAAGAVLVNGTLSVTESGADIFAGTGDASDIVFGNLIVTESADGFAGVGRVDIIGSLAGMEVDADSILISGSSVRTGYLDATESGSDTFSATQPSVLTLTAADLAAIDALIVARISDIAAATLAAAQVTPIHSNVQAGQSGIANAVWSKTLP